MYVVFVEEHASTPAIPTANTGANPEYRFLFMYLKPTASTEQRNAIGIGSAIRSRFIVMRESTRPGAYDRGLSTEERAAEQRDRIIAAAASLYSEKGYYDTGIADIVAQAHVSKRTVYAHFRDLGELRFAVYERAVSRTFVELTEIAQDKTAPDRLKAGLTLMFDMIKTSPKLGRVVVAEFRLPEPRNIALRRQIISLFVGILMEGTKEDHLDGRVPHPPDELTMFALVGAIEGLALKFLDEEDQQNSQTRKPEAMDIDRAVPVLLHVFRSVYPWRPPA
jgi:AcrR family transcriptional regulator